MSDKNKIPVETEQNENENLFDQPLKGDLADSFGIKTVGALLLWLGLPLIIGLLLGGFLIPQPAVGLIHLEMDIFSAGIDLDSVDLVMDQIEIARQDPSIKAVVFVLDSPGGEVVATQTLYLELQDLRREMPVVGLINGIAASGGYYIAMATDPIYAKPSSTIGNVGVWGFVPSEIGVNEVILASGPFKLTASNRDEFLREIEGIKQEFIGTVTSQRGDRLTISVSDLSQGLAYSGRIAKELGLVDELGSQSDAISKAAELAGISNYTVLDLQDIVLREIFGDDILIQPWIGSPDPVTGRRILPPGAYLLYDLQIGGVP